MASQWEKQRMNSANTCSHSGSTLGMPQTSFASGYPLVYLPCHGRQEVLQPQSVALLPLPVGDDVVMLAERVGEPDVSSVSMPTIRVLSELG